MAQTEEEFVDLKWLLQTLQSHDLTSRAHNFWASSSIQFNNISFSFDPERSTAQAVRITAAYSKTKFTTNLIFFQLIHKIRNPQRKDTYFIVHLCLTDDNKKPDPQYEAFIAALAEADEDEVTEKPKKRLRSRFTRSPGHAPWNTEAWDEEDDHNPAQPSSTESPDSNTRRQEFLAKVSAAAGSMYIS